LILLAHSLRRVRTIVMAMGALLAGFQVLLIFVGKSIHTSGSFEEMSALIPTFVREMLGPSITSFMSFSGIVCLGYFHPVVMSSLVGLCIALGTMTTSEIETGFMDLILSRPMARHWIITRSIVVGTMCTFALLITMMIATWAGLKAAAPKDAAWPASDLILALAGNLALLMLCWTGVALAIATVSRRRIVAGTLTGLLALATFLLDYIARAWRPAESLAWLSPFRYFSPFELLMGASIPVKNLVVLGGAAGAGFALAYFFFSRRDISH
jgi:ABC-2 type transport system permease protein